MKILNFIIIACASLIISSCASNKLVTYNVSYLSVRTKNAQPTQSSPIPKEKKIVVVYSISNSGELTAIVYNRTPEIMIIDQTKSFFVNSDGKSTSYYDPTVRTTSTTDLSTSTKGASVNLGAITGALGIGGVVGQIANGVNVGGSGTDGTSTTNTTYIADLPQVSLAPNSNGAMSKVFSISGIGRDNSTNPLSLVNLTDDQSFCRFSVCISYSLDGGASYEKIVTDFYANSKIVVPVTENGVLNEALQKIYATKTDAIHEYWWTLYFNNNMPVTSARTQGLLYDYQ